MLWIKSSVPEEPVVKNLLDITVQLPIYIYSFKKCEPNSVHLSFFICLPSQGDGILDWMSQPLNIMLLKSVECLFVWLKEVLA